MKIAIVIPAYNAEKTLRHVFRRIKPRMKKEIDEFIIVDDGSSDKTNEVAKKFSKIVIRHATNRGYGGAQKSGFRRALDDKADIIVLLHADGQYPPEDLESMIEPIKNGKADVVLGSRILGKKALQGGMPIHRYIGNRLLTMLENLILRMNVSEYHTGYRAYSRDFLEKTKFNLNSEKYIFDSEILIQAKEKKARIKEIPIPTRYGEEISYLNPLKYGLGILSVLSYYILHKLHINRQKKYL